MIFFFKIKCTLFLIHLFSVTLFAQYPNVRVDGGLAYQPNEVTIAINPTNPLNLVAGSNLHYIYYSEDGGHTWTTDVLESSVYGVWGDPAVTFDVHGNVYFGHLSFPPGYVGYKIDRIVVQKSTDSGKSWDIGKGIGYNGPPRIQDKEWIITDQTDSPYRGNIYLSWTEFDQYRSFNPSDSSRIRFARSTDGSETWSNPVVISDKGGDCQDGDFTVEGAVPAVGPNGEVYVAWAGPDGIWFDKSYDGGVTFNKDVFVGTQPGGWNMFVWGIFRSNGLPITICDISQSPYRGNVYICWADQRNGAANSDVFIIKSEDGGETWGEAVRVNNDNSDGFQFFPWACVDPITGYIWVVFYDRRISTGNMTEVYVARSSDGGKTFSNFKVSETPFTPQSDIFFGDYTNIAARDGKVYPIWMRMDKGFLSIWTALIDDTSSTGVNTPEYVIRDYSLSQNYPNPFNGQTTFTYRLPGAGHVQLTIYNNKGQEIQSLVNRWQPTGAYSVTWDALGLSSGIYFYILKTGSFFEMKKCLLIK